MTDLTEPTDSSSRAQAGAGSRRAWTVGEIDELWRPSHWRDQPRPGRGLGLRTELLVVGILAAYNLLVNLVIPEAWHVPTNLAVAVGLVLLVRQAGATWTDLALRADRVGRGFVVGLVFLAIVAGAVALSSLVPDSREAFFEDERVTDATTAEILYEAFIRIPFATALFEEVAFRGVLFGILLRRMSPLAAASWAAGLFGLWHVVPTLATLEVNPAGDLFTSPPAIAAAVVGAVIGTGIAGYGFTWVRLRANSIVAPTLLHIATNTSALLTAWIVVSATK